MTLPAREAREKAPALNMEVNVAITLPSSLFFNLPCAPIGTMMPSRFSMPFSLISSSKVESAASTDFAALSIIIRTFRISSALRSMRKVDSFCSPRT